MRKALVPLVISLFTAVISPVHATNMTTTARIVQIQNLNELTPDETTICMRYARQLANILHTTPYSEFKGIERYKFVEKMGKCIADEFNQIAPPGYMLEKVGDEYWLKVHGLVSFNTHNSFP